MPRLVMIDRRLSLPEVAVRASMLEAYGIPVATGGRLHAAMHWFVLFAIGGVAIQVPDEVQDTARALLEPLNPVASGAELFESRWFWKRPVRHALGAALVFVGLPMPVWLATRSLWVGADNESLDKVDSAAG